MDRKRGEPTGGTFFLSEIHRALERGRERQFQCTGSLSVMFMLEFAYFRFGITLQGDDLVRVFKTLLENSTLQGIRDLGGCKIFIIG